jgi:hypothetical protein
MHKSVASLALAAVVTIVVALCRTAAFNDYELRGYDFLVIHANSEERYLTLSSSILMMPLLIASNSTQFRLPSPKLFRALPQARRG